MIPLPANVRVWLATGHTDMRKGFSSLGLIVQETLRRDPHSGHLFVFRGRRGDLIKVIWHDGQGACLYTKRLDRLLRVRPAVRSRPQAGPDPRGGLLGSCPTQVLRAGRSEEGPDRHRGRDADRCDLRHRARRQRSCPR